MAVATGTNAFIGRRSSLSMAAASADQTGGSCVTRSSRARLRLR